MFILVVFTLLSFTLDFVFFNFVDLGRIWLVWGVAFWFVVCFWVADLICGLV